jgi:hypothetical protein
MTFDELVNRLPARAEEQALAEVDLSDLLGEGVVFRYRAPRVPDLYAANDPEVLREWRIRYPDYPQLLHMQLELMARLHVEPSTQRPAGEIYAQLIEKLPPTVAQAVLKRIGDTLVAAFQLEQIEERVESKKGSSRKGKG